jgi:hypothetical protein
MKCIYIMPTGTEYANAIEHYRAKRRKWLTTLEVAFLACVSAALIGTAIYCAFRLAQNYFNF